MLSQCLLYIEPLSQLSVVHGLLNLAARSAPTRQEFSFLFFLQRNPPQSTSRYRFFELNHANERSGAFRYILAPLTGTSDVEVTGATGGLGRISMPFTSMVCMCLWSFVSSRDPMFPFRRRISWLGYKARPILFSFGSQRIGIQAGC